MAARVMTGNNAVVSSSDDAAVFIDYDGADRNFSGLTSLFSFDKRFWLEDSQLQLPRLSLKAEIGRFVR